MTKLTSKLQYNNFETGEFVEEKKRTYEETISAIEAFPWVAQRDHLLIGLTNPSITLQKDNNSFLKLAVFFNSKFVLHYFTAEEVLFTKSFTRLQDTYPYIQNYFTSAEFDTTDFRKENTWLQHNSKHFISQSFYYEVTPETTKQFIWRTSALNIVFSIFFVILFLFNAFYSKNFIAALVTIAYIFLAGGGLNFILFLNYYNYAKNKVLILSKGNDIFYYGDRESPTQFNKKDILQVTSVRHRNGRSPVNAFGFIIIDFNNATTIKIPDIFVGIKELENKFTGCTQIAKGGFPYIRS